MSRVIPCQVVPAGTVTVGDVLWIAGDGFQKVREKRPLANASAFLLANGIVSNRFDDDQALIQARKAER